MTNAIEVRNVGVRRAGALILSDVSMTVEAGGCCAILGPNGSGKSALLAVLSGYLWPTLGTVCVDGQVYGHVPLGEVRRKIGLLERPDSPTVVIVSHHLDELPRAVSRVVLLKAGRIVGEGVPEEFLTSAHLSALFDCRVDVLRNDGRYVARIDPP